MTLWDLMVLWLKRHRPRLPAPRMVAWPYWSRPQRFNMIQRWAMRRGLLIVVALVVLRVNPFTSLSMLLILLTGTAVMVEHFTHKRQDKALYASKPIKWM